MINKLLKKMGFVLIKKETIDDSIEWIDTLVGYQKDGYGLDDFDAQTLESVSDNLKKEMV